MIWKNTFVFNLVNKNNVSIFWHFYFMFVIYSGCCTQF